jgi:hypothetical protein
VLDWGWLEGGLRGGLADCFCVIGGHLVGIYLVIKIGKDWRFEELQIPFLGISKRTAYSDEGQGVVAILGLLASSESIFAEDCNRECLIFNFK